MFVFFLYHLLRISNDSHNPYMCPQKFCKCKKNQKEIEMTQIKNLTPHAITLIQERKQIVVPPSGTVASVSMVASRLLESFLPVEVWSTPTFGEVVGLPPPEEGVILLVSNIVASAAKREDVYGLPLTFANFRPDDGTVRNEQCRVIGFTRLMKMV